MVPLTRLLAVYMRCSMWNMHALPEESPAKSREVRLVERHRLDDMLPLKQFWANDRVCSLGNWDSVSYGMDPWKLLLESAILTSSV